MLITNSDISFEKSQLIAPFGFKGQYINNLWQGIVKLKSGEVEATGISTQSILWSGPEVFANTLSDEGNALMLCVTAYAARLVNGMTLQSPYVITKDIFDNVYQKAVEITGIKNLSPVFVMNALVPLDNALWILYAKANQITKFDEVLPFEFKGLLQDRQNSLALVPLAGYNTSLQEIQAFGENGTPVIKIKLGNSKGDGVEAMLGRDFERIRELHSVLNQTTDKTEIKKIYYYLDANNQYPNKDCVVKLLEFAEKIDAREQILLIEEPLPIDSMDYVGNLGVAIGADESAHCKMTTRNRLELGYSVIALKPIAKTLSLTLDIIKEVKASKAEMFCADLTVNPSLLCWNRNIASRLPRLKGLNCGIIESNGAQNYTNWDELCRRHPNSDKKWFSPINGQFELDNDFFDGDGGCFSDIK